MAHPRPPERALAIPPDPNEDPPDEFTKAVNKYGPSVASASLLLLIAYVLSYGDAPKRMRLK